MSKEDPKVTDNVNTVDLGYGAVPPDYSNISYSGGVDTITLDPAWTNMATSITSPSTWTTSSVGATGSTYTINTGAGLNGTSYVLGSSAISYNNVNINSNGIDMKDGTDITIDGKSLKQFMDKMEERLAILVPDPKKMEKFEALKKAYEHYKLMEKLCQEEKKED